MVEIIEIDCKHWNMEEVETGIPAEVQALGLTSQNIFDKWLGWAKSGRGLSHFNREVKAAAEMRDMNERQSRNPALSPAIQDNYKRAIQENNRIIALNNWFLANRNYKG